MASVSSSDSESEDIKRLVIYAVQKYPLLYDVKLADYSNRQKCDLAWEEIGNELGISSKGETAPRFNE